MRKERLAIVEAIRPHLIDNELMMEALIEGGGRLVSVVLQARREAGLSGVGSAAVARLTEFQACANQAYGHLMAAHKEMAASAQHELRLPVTAWGPDDCPPPSGEEHPQLRVVA